MSDSGLDNAWDWLLILWITTLLGWLALLLAVVFERYGIAP